VLNRVKYFTKRVRRLIRWIPIIWRSHTWDWSYTAQILVHSLEELEKDLLNDPYHTQARKRAKQLQVVKNCIKRIIEEDYCSKEWDEYFKEYPPKFLRVGEISRAQVKRSIYLRDKEEKLRQLDEDLIIKYVKKYYRGWWT